MKALKYTETKIVNNAERRVIKIELSDDLKNMHNDFHVDFYTEKLCWGEWRRIYTPTKHTIKRSFPAYVIFEELDGCTAEGAPWFAVENGIYHLKESIAKGADYLRISEDLASTLDTEDKEHFKYQLHELGIIATWKEKAQKAIALLQLLCGEKFEDYADCIKRNDLKMTDEERARVEERIASGYYTPQAIAERKAEKEEERRERERARITARFDKTIADATMEKEIILAVFDMFGTDENVILYNYNKTLTFNWKEPQFALYCKHWTEDEFARFNIEGEELIKKYGLETSFAYQY